MINCSTDRKSFRTNATVLDVLDHFSLHILLSGAQWCKHKQNPSRRGYTAQQKAHLSSPHGPVRVRLRVASRLLSLFFFSPKSQLLILLRQAGHRPSLLRLLPPEATRTRRAPLPATSRRRDQASATLAGRPWAPPAPATRFRGWSRQVCVCPRSKTGAVVCFTIPLKLSNPFGDCDSGRGISFARQVLQGIFWGGVGDTFLCCCSDDFLKVTPKLVSYQQLMVIFSDRLTALRYLGNLRVEASRSLQNILPSKCLAFWFDYAGSNFGVENASYRTWDLSQVYRFLTIVNRNSALRGLISICSRFDPFFFLLFFWCNQQLVWHWR